MKRATGPSAGTRLNRAFEERYRDTPYRELPWFSPRPPEFVAEAVRRGQVIRSGRSLDLGCGAGTLALWLARHGYDAHGLDFSPSAIAAANGRKPARARSPTFHVGSVLDLPFPAHWADLATDIGLYHTLSPSARTTYAAQLARVLRPEGDFLLAVFAREERRPQGPPYRLSVAEVLDVFEPRFQVLRADASRTWGEPDGLKSYEFHLRRRRGAQPPGGALWR